jgi:hypothetical protein
MNVPLKVPPHGSHQLGKPICACARKRKKKKKKKKKQEEELFKQFLKQREEKKKSKQDEEELVGKQRTHLPVHVGLIFLFFRFH